MSVKLKIGMLVAAIFVVGIGATSATAAAAPGDGCKYGQIQAAKPRTCPRPSPSPAQSPAPRRLRIPNPARGYEDYTCWVQVPVLTRDQIC